MPETVEAPQANADIEADLAEIPFRQPVVDDYNPELRHRRPGESDTAFFARNEEDRKARKARDTRIDNEWLAVTEAARRSIVQSPDTRQALTRFSSEPLSEGMPEEALAALAGHDKRIDRLARLAGKNLGAVLKLSPVPDELLVPDLSNSSLLITKESEAASLARAKAYPPKDYDAQLAYVRRKVENRPGVTPAERELVARRYRYAREVKLLSLMAELSDQPIGAGEVQNGTISHELTSGTKLVMSSEAFAASPGLLDPQKWESRRQLKDRVYNLAVGGKEYIMKERKTPRHTDVKEHGHIDGLTSQQEFETATEFAGLGTIRQGDIELSWEKPLGYVEFPDGYQFCLFESEPGLDTDEPRNQLENEILASAEEYEEEFEHVRTRAREIYEQRKDLTTDRYYEKPKAQLKRFAVSKAARRENEQEKQWVAAQPEADELTYEEFAVLKAHYMIKQASELLEHTMLDRDYTNSDIDGFGFRLAKGKRPTLEIIGFDFEYYIKNPQEAERIKRNIKKANENGEAANSDAYRFGNSRPIMVDASYGMLEDRGMRLPPPRKS